MDIAEQLVTRSRRGTERGAEQVFFDATEEVERLDPVSRRWRGRLAAGALATTAVILVGVGVFGRSESERVATSAQPQAVEAIGVIDPRPGPAVRIPVSFAQPDLSLLPDDWSIQRYWTSRSQDSETWASASWSLSTGEEEVIVRIGPGTGNVPTDDQGREAVILDLANGAAEATVDSIGDDRLIQYATDDVMVSITARSVDGAVEVAEALVLVDQQLEGPSDPPALPTPPDSIELGSVTSGQTTAHIRVTTQTQPTVVLELDGYQQSVSGRLANGTVLLDVLSHDQAHLIAVSAGPDVVAVETTDGQALTQLQIPDTDYSVWAGISIETEPPPLLRAELADGKTRALSLGTKVERGWSSLSYGITLG